MSSLAVARTALDQARRDLRAHVSRQHPDRHHLGLPECPRVVEAADVVEVLESRVRLLVRRERLQ